MDNKEKLIREIREVLPYLSDNQLTCINGIIQLKHPEIYNYECRSGPFNVDGKWSSIQYIGNKSNPIKRDNIVAVRLIDVTYDGVNQHDSIFDSCWFELIDDDVARGYRQGDEFLKVEDFHELNSTSPIYFNITIGETNSSVPIIISFKIDLNKMLINSVQLALKVDQNTTRRVLKCKTVSLDFLIRTKKPTYMDDLREMD